MKTKMEFKKEVQEGLSLMVEKEGFGLFSLSESKRLANMLSGYALSENEMNLLNLAINYGIPNKLLSEHSDTDRTQKNWLKNLIIKFSEDNFLSEDIGKNVVLLFANALGWKVNLDSDEQIDLIPFRKGDKWGFSDKDRNIIIPCKYNYVSPFRNGLARVNLHRKYGYVDKEGTVIVPFKYDEAWDFHEGLAAVGFNGKYGYVDKQGREKISLKYDSASYFREGFAVVEMNDKCSCIDTSGKELVPFKYDSFLSFEDGVARVQLNGKADYIDATGRELTNFRYDFMWRFYEGMAAVQLNGKWGYIDKTGKEVIPPIYLESGSCADGLVRVDSVDGSGLSGFIDKKGEVVIPCKYCWDEGNWGFSEGLVVVSLEYGKYFYINRKDEVVIPHREEFLEYNFFCGRALVYNGKYGYIDRNGNNVIPMIYDYAAEFFYEGFADVELNGKYGFIDTSGKVIIPINPHCSL